MTNKEWRRSRDPVAMIRGIRDIAGDRKSLLYMVAGCRMLGDVVYSMWSEEALEIAERYADGGATSEEFDRAGSVAGVPTFGHQFEPGIWRAWHPDGTIPSDVRRLIQLGVITERSLEEDEPQFDPELGRRASAAAELVYFTCRNHPLANSDDHILEFISRVNWPGDWLLRCVFGKPFLPAASIDPSWLTRNVVGLARSVYEGRDFEGMPILGDALEEAGCTHEDILKHCRSQQPHVRGCWVVDLLLGMS